jgi:translocation protein SEC63
MKYNYDETGAIFSYFLLTLFTIVLVPLTYATVFKREVESPVDLTWEKCVDKQRYLNRKKKPSYRWLYLLIGWALFGLIAYQAVTIVDNAPEVWDPFAILKVDPDSDEKAIKKAFKKLSLIYHPDKVKVEDREEAEKQFIEISKAYKVYDDFI